MLLEIHARKIWMKYFTWKRSTPTCSFATRSNLLFSEIHLVAHKGMYRLIFSCINNEIREIQLLSNNILYALGQFSRHLRISQKWWENLLILTVSAKIIFPSKSPFSKFPSKFPSKSQDDQSKYVLSPFKMTSKILNHVFTIIGLEKSELFKTNHFAI